MTRDDVVKRARSAVGQRTRYRMGGGSLDPSTPSPRGADDSCDCSAFVCWCLGIRKYQPDFAALVAFNGGWLNTDGIWYDASRLRVGLFEPVELDKLRPGDALVYPAARVAGGTGPKVGHTGIVVEVASGKATRVIHCSSGNWRNGGDAISQTDNSVFERVQYTIGVRCISTTEV